MFEEFKENLIGIITSRTFVLMLVLMGFAGALIHQIFDLQIVNGEAYLDNFQLKIMKERTIQGTRGNIYDCNGNLLAYNELAYSVTIEDVYESGKTKNQELNSAIATLIKMIEKNGDKIVSDFKIMLDKDGNYAFTVSGDSLLRFLADVYGHTTVDLLEYKEKTASPDDVIAYLGKNSKFGIGNYADPDDKNSFQVGLGYTKEETLKIMTIRYDMSTNSYKKYIATTVATNVSEETVAVIMENADILEGVSISEDTIRKYVDSVYMSQIIGYTGKVSQEELDTLNADSLNPRYDSNDTVGKLGIEQSMETTLQGTKGSETVFVNSVGKVIETSSYVEPVAGNDVYLTINKELQEAAYNIIEQKLASILVAKIANIKEYTAAENATAANILIPIYDVYFALINNNVIDISHFAEKTAGENEQAIYASFLSSKEQVFERLRKELQETKTVYDSLDKEYQVYESYIIDMLYSKGVIDKASIDTTDETYIAWTTDEVISLNEYINYCIAMNWVDVTKLNLDSQYSDSEEIFNKIVDYTFTNLDNNTEFFKKIYKYMIKSDVITGKQICHVLLEQDIVEIETEEEENFKRGAVSAYNFMMARISSLDITPAQLALDPCSGSTVITDVRTGDVLALVSYPGYDNNKMANGVDADYFSDLLNDLSTPMINYATQQKTAPGSTFKMVSATAGLLEGTITTSSTVNCTGVFDWSDHPPTCWIYPRGSHGALNVTGAIKNSCNVFFYELGYRLGLVGDTYYPSTGLEKLKTYADMYGLTEVSGVEIEESLPQVSDADAVRSAIGQGTNNYTTAGLARYVTTVANSGTCYNLTLVDKISDHNGNLLSDNEATVRNNITMDSSYWNAIHQGMRQVVEAKTYFSDIGVTVAGKTGTAQENKSRPSHALFVCYAPYEEPEIAIATRIAFGYSSDYAAQTAKEIIQFYFKLADEEEIITGTAGQLSGGSINAD